MIKHNYEQFSTEYPNIRCIRLIWDEVMRRYRHETKNTSNQRGEITFSIETPIKNLKDGDIAHIGSYYDSGPTPFLAIKQGDTLYCSNEQETWKLDEWRLLYEFLNNGVPPKRAIEMIEL